MLSLKDLGFPSSAWAAKDTVVLIGGLASVVLTVLALRAKDHADRDVLSASLPEVGIVGEDDTERQVRFARQRAVQRAAMARSLLRARTSSTLFVLAVVASGVASMPWLLVPAFLLAVIWTLAGYRCFSSGSRAIGDRLALLELVRDFYRYSVATPFMTDATIFSSIEAVFATPDDQLALLQQNIMVSLIERRKEHRLYIAARQSSRPSG